MSRTDALPGSPRRENGAPSRWEQYRELMAAKRIPQKAQRWHVTHVQDFLAVVKPSSVKGLSADEINGYLRQKSSQGKWQDWQFRQLVDALQIKSGNHVLLASPDAMSGSKLSRAELPGHSPAIA